jgi:hypothetical protein
MPTTSDLRIRITPEQKRCLLQLVESSGFKSVSDYARARLFGFEFSLDKKINRILELLEGGKNEKTNKR